MTYYDETDIFGDFDFLDEELIEEIPLNVKIESMSNSILLDELLSFIDFSGYDEDYISALDVEIKDRLKVWLSEQ